MDFRTARMLPYAGEIDAKNAAVVTSCRSAFPFQKKSQRSMVMRRVVTRITASGEARTSVCSGYAYLYFSNISQTKRDALVSARTHLHLTERRIAKRDERLTTLSSGNLRLSRKNEARVGGGS